jgi:phosphate-selective porin OprO/OprP
MERAIAVMSALAACLGTAAAQDSVQDRIQALEEMIKKQQVELQDLRAQIEAPRPAAPAPQEKPETFRVFWNDGLRLETADKAFRLAIGGRIQDDWAIWIDPPDDLEAAVGSLDDGTAFRRARLYIGGTIYEQAEFMLQPDFAGGDVAFKDAYIGLRDLPVVGRVRVGQVYEPIGMEDAVSDNYITFIERSVIKAFLPDRQPGLRLDNTAFDGRLKWAAGVFHEADTAGDDSGDGEFTVTGRLTGLPWFDDDGMNLLHLGIGASHREADGGFVRLRQRPEVFIAPQFVDTGSFRGEASLIWDAELALKLGSFCLVGEYISDTVQRPSGLDDVRFDGAVVYASYFLTGEDRPYQTSEGAFGRVHPKENFPGGPGAWEVGARYSTIDLDDGPISGGSMESWTVGVNWYLNPNVRFMFNYVMPRLDGFRDADVAVMRFQVDF